MRAVLIATGYNAELLPLLHYRPAPLLHIVDRPLIIIILEFLVKQGIKQYDVVLSHLPEMIEEELEEGRRWGIEITYHLVKEPSRPFIALRPAAQGWHNEAVLLGFADCLPSFDLVTLTQSYENLPTLLSYPSKVWSGWGLFSSTFLGQVDAKSDESQFLKWVKSNPYKVYPVHHFLSVKTLVDLQKTNLKLIQTKTKSDVFPLTAKLIDKGVWISRAATIHPSAKLKPPVFIGENCQIKEGARIGPHVLIENHCVIDKLSVVENALICQNSYIGERLEVINSIVDRNLLINLILNTSIAVVDDFILSELKTPSFKRYVLKSLGRYAAALLFIFLAPLFFLSFLFCKLTTKKFVYLPAPYEKVQWKTFEWMAFERKSGPSSPFLPRFLTYLPLLINIIRGEVHFVGLYPRTSEEIEQLPSDWKNLYLKSKIGIITLAQLEHPESCCLDDLYTAEAYYTANMSLWYDFKLCWRWLGHQISALWK